MAKDKKAKDPLAPTSTKIKKSSRKKKQPIVPGKKFKSADLITASDDEEMDDAPAASSKSRGQLNGKSSDGSDDDASDSDSWNASAAAVKKTIPKKPTGEPAKQSSDDDEDDDDNEPSPAPTPIRKPTASVPKPSSSRSKEDATTNGRIEHELPDSEMRPSTTYKAPQGYKSVKDDTVASATVDLFRPKNTKEKEIWYISAPSSLPITALKEVALQKFAKQQAIMEHEGEHYALVADPAVRESTRVLLPQQKSGYRVIETPVKHVLQFQQVLSVQATASIGRPKTTSQVLLDTDLPTKDEKRPQPRGMRMKFRPSGFGDGYLGSIGSSDEESLPSPSQFRHPPALDESSTPSGKRKQEERADKSEKKKKKRVKEQQSVTAQEAADRNATYVTEATTAIDADQETAPPEARSKDGKKKKKKDREGVEIATGMEPDDEPMNGATIPKHDQGVNIREDSRKEKKKKKKDKHNREAEDDARAINGSAMDVDATADAADTSGKKRKKEKKQKKAELEHVEA